MTIIADCLGNN